MTTLTIRNVDPALRDRLRIRAAHHGRSMEAELRRIIGDALAGGPKAEVNLADAIRRRVDAIGGGDVPALPPMRLRDPPTFE